MAKFKSGRHASAVKEWRKTQTRTSHNRWVLKNIRLLAKKIEVAISEKKVDEAKKMLPECFSAWDKASKIGLIHFNTASRKKSRLSTKISQTASVSA